MKMILIGMVMFFVALFVVILYCCLIVSSKSDDAMEELTKWKTDEEKNHS